MARRRANMSPRGAGLFMLIFGIIWFFCGILTAKQYNANEAKKKICTQSTSAIVTQIDSKRETYRSNGKTKHRTVYYASFEYEVNGQKYSGREHTQSSTSKGDTISIFYNPDDPAEYISSATMNGQGALKTISIVIKAIGGVIAVVGLFKLVTGKQFGS